MKLEIKHPKNGCKNKPQLIRYFDMSWMTVSQILLTEQGKKSGLGHGGICYRIRSKEYDTLEKLLSKNKRIKSQPKSKKIKIRGTFLVPEVYGKPMITKDILIGESEYNAIKDKPGLVEQHFIHAIADKLKIECVRVG